MTRRKKKPEYDPRSCRQCDRDFVPNRGNQVFCDAECKTAWHADLIATALEHYRECETARLTPEWKRYHAVSSDDD